MLDSWVTRNWLGFPIEGVKPSISPRFANDNAGDLNTLGRSGVDLDLVVSITRPKTRVACAEMLQIKLFLINVRLRTQACSQVSCLHFSCSVCFPSIIRRNWISSTWFPGSWHTLWDLTRHKNVNTWRFQFVLSVRDCDDINHEVIRDSWSSDGVFAVIGVKNEAIVISVIASHL